MPTLLNAKSSASDAEETNDVDYESNAVGTIVSFAHIISAKALSALKNDENGALWIQILVIVLCFAGLVLVVAVTDVFSKWLRKNLNKIFW